MQGAEERRLRRMGSNTPQGGAIEGNAADDALMVDQGVILVLTRENISSYLSASIRKYKDVFSGAGSEQMLTQH